MQEPPVELQDLGCSPELSSRLDKATERCQAIFEAPTFGAYAALAVALPLLVKAVCTAIWDACKNTLRDDARERKCLSAITLLECCLYEAKRLVAAPKPTLGAHKSSHAHNERPENIETLFKKCQAELPGLGCTLQAVDNWKTVRFYPQFCDVEKGIASAIAVSTSCQSGCGLGAAKSDGTCESALMQVEDGPDVPDANAPAQSSSNGASSNPGNGRGVRHANTPARGSFNAANTREARDPGLNENAIPEVHASQDRSWILLSSTLVIACGVACIWLGTVVFSAIGIGTSRCYNPDQPRWMLLMFAIPTVVTGGLVVVLGIMLIAWGSEGLRKSLPKSRCTE